MFRYIYVEEKFKFFINYNKQSRNFHYNALKALKMLWFPTLCQWTLPGLCILTLSGGSQFLVHLSCIGNLLSHVGDYHPK